MHRLSLWVSLVCLGGCLPGGDEEHPIDDGGVLEATDAGRLGTRDDAGSVFEVDAGAGVDAGSIVDGGMHVDAGLHVDAGAPMDASLDMDAGMEAMADAGDAGAPLDGGTIEDPRGTLGCSIASPTILGPPLQTGADDHAATVWTGDGWLNVQAEYREVVDGRSDRIIATPVTRDGSLGAPVELLTLSTTWGVGVDEIKAVWTGTEAMVAWENYVVGDAADTVTIARVAADGSLIAAPIEVGSIHTDLSMELVLAGDRVALLVHGDGAIRMWTFALDGSLLGAEMLVDHTAGVTRWSVAWNGVELGLAWIDGLAPRFMGVGLDGVAHGPVALSAPGAGDCVDPVPLVRAEGSRWIVAVRQRVSTTTPILVYRLEADGALRDVLTLRFLVEGRMPEFRHFDLVIDGSGYALAHVVRSHPWRTELVRLDASGAALGPAITFVERGGDTWIVGPTLVRAGGELVLVWNDDQLAGVFRAIASACPP